MVITLVIFQNHTQQDPDSSADKCQYQCFGHDQPENLPEGMNSKHRSGIWIRVSDCDWLSAGNGFACGMILGKPYWISGIAPESEQQFQPIDELKATVEKHFKN